MFYTLARKVPGSTSTKVYNGTSPVKQQEVALKIKYEKL